MFGRGIVAAVLLAGSMIGGLAGAQAASASTTLHYTSNGNLVGGVYVPGSQGFNLVDVSSPGELSEVPSGLQALVYLGLCGGADPTFTSTIAPYVGNPDVFGFYLMDEPDPTGIYKTPCLPANLKAESDWIHQNDPGAKTFVVLMNLSSSATPNYVGTYNPSNSDIDLYGLDPYPCRTELDGCDDSYITKGVAAAESSGIPQADIVPVFQAFGGGDDGDGGQYAVPTVGEEQSILETWDSVVPDPVFDYAYSWGEQNGDTALSSLPDLQAVFAAHNGASWTGPTPTRIAGSDAIGTAIAVSQGEFPAPGSARSVVLARSDFFADALAGGPLAAAKEGPLLITPGASQSQVLDPRVTAEISRVLAPGGTVYVLGGTAALAPDIDPALEALGFKVVREAGADEYGTAVDIAEAMGDPSTIFEATGLDFSDALSAVPAAIETGGAILLTEGSAQSPETASYLAAHPADIRYAIGGPLAAYGADPSATAVFGSDLYGTCAAVATTFFPHADTFGVATGLDFSDALAGGVFMATGGRSGPLLLVDPTGVPPVPAGVSGYLSELGQVPGFVFGGPLAVSGAVLGAL
ncbi:MAG: cell wall-binding repeat-containing protein [Acidimicrobiales bacterium]